MSLINDYLSYFARQIVINISTNSTDTLQLHKKKNSYCSTSINKKGRFFLELFPLHVFSLTVPPRKADLVRIFLARKNHGCNKTSIPKSCRPLLYHYNVEIPTSDYVKDTINKLYSMFSVYNSSQKSKNQALIDTATQKNAIEPDKVGFAFESKNSLIIIILL